VFYVDQTLNVHELYNPSSAEVDQWFHNQLTQGATGAPPVQDVEGQLSSCFDSHNIEHVFYIAENNHVEELYFYNGRLVESRQETAHHAKMLALADHLSLAV